MDNRNQERFSVEDLLEDAGWMQSIAQVLVRGAEGAEDVVQQSWLMALERPPRHGGQLRGWLRQVVQNQARRMGRGDTRRAWRERESATPEALPSSEALALAAETQREVVNAILSLEEPYRSTILLRFYHDLSPAQIAARQGVPGATVRGRIKRALVMLREKLDRHYGQRDVWSFALMPLLGSAAGVFLSVQLKLLLGGLALFLLAGAAWMLRPAPGAVVGPPLSQLIADSMETMAGAEEPARAQVVKAEDSESGIQERRAIQAFRASTGPVLRGSVGDLMGDPVRGARVAIYATKTVDPESVDAWGEALSDEEGNFEIPILKHWQAEERFKLIVSCAGYVELSIVKLLDQEPIAIQLLGSCDLYGRLLDDENGVPLPGVWGRCGNQEFRTDVEGTFLLPGLAVGRNLQLLIQAQGYAWRKFNFLLAAGPREERVIRLARGHALELQVFDVHSGDPMAGVQLSLNGRFYGRSDSDGAIALRVLQGQEWTLRFDKEDHALFTWHLEVKLLENLKAAHVPMRGLGWIEGILTDGQGAPLTESRIFLQSSAWGAKRRTTSDEEARELGLLGPSYHEAGYARDEGAITSNEGKFRLPVVPGSTANTIVGGSRKHVPLSMGGLLVTMPGQRLWVDAVQESGATIYGRVLRNGHPMGGSVLADSPEGDNMGAARVASDGSFRMDNVVPGTVVLRFRDNYGDRAGFPMQAPLQLNPGDIREHDLRWEMELHGIGGVVQSGAGIPWSGQWVRIESSEMSSSPFQAQTDEEGRFLIEVLPGMSYTVSASKGPLHAIQHGVSPGTENLVLVMPEAGHFRFMLRDSESRAPVDLDQSHQWGIHWRPKGEEAFRLHRSSFGRGPHFDLSVPFLPDAPSIDLQLFFNKNGYQPILVSGLVVVPEGQEAPLTEIELTRGVDCGLTVQGQGAIPSQGHLILLLHEDQRDSVRGPYASQGGPSNTRINDLNMWLREYGLLEQEPGFDGEGFALVQGLQPGRYELRCFPDDLVFEPASFELRAREPGAEDSPLQKIELKWSWR